jgi:hypothetical protein
MLRGTVTSCIGKNPNIWMVGVLYARGTNCETLLITPYYSGYPKPFLDIKKWF